MLGGATRRHQFKSDFEKPAADLDGFGLVFVANAQKRPPFEWQPRSGAQLRLGERFAELLTDAHHLAGGSHLGAEDGVHSMEFREGKDWRLHAKLLDRQHSEKRTSGATVLEERPGTPIQRQVEGR